MSIDRVSVPGVTRSLFLCARSDAAPDPERALAAAGEASLMVCLNEEDELTAKYPDYVEWLRINQGERALWHPTRDWHARPLASALPAVLMVSQRLERGEGVLMHCAMGQGRAGTMAVCVLMALGVDREEALRAVAEQRLHAGPASRSQWRLVDAVEQFLGTGGSAPGDGSATSPSVN